MAFHPVIQLEVHKMWQRPAQMLINTVEKNTSDYLQYFEDYWEQLLKIIL